MKRKWYLIGALVVLFAFMVAGFKHTSVAPTDSESLVGKIAPDFKLENIDGGQTSLSDFKGKVVYLDFWATWCKPCIEEMKKSKALKESFAGDKNVVFLYVSIDTEADKWKAYVKNNQVAGVHLISREGEEEKVKDRYNINFIPRCILIDKEGRIVQYEAKLPSESSLVGDIQDLLNK